MELSALEATLPPQLHWITRSVMPFIKLLRRAPPAAPLAYAEAVIDQRQPHPVQYDELLLLSNICDDFVMASPMPRGDDISCLT